MWVKTSDDHTNRPEVRAIGPLGIAMELAGTCHANHELTDGFIPHATAHTLLNYSIARADGQVYTLCVKSKKGTVPIDSEWVVGLMVEAGLWDEVPGGYQIRNYHDNQPTADHAKVVSEARAEAGRKGGLQRAANVKAKQIANQNGKQNA